MTLHIYQDHSSEWRWRLKARNGRIVAESGEGYKRKAYALKTGKELFLKAKVVLDEDDADSLAIGLKRYFRTKPTPAGGFRGMI